MEPDQRVELGNLQPSAWPALKHFVVSSNVTAVCCIVVDTFGRIYRTADSSGAYRKRCFGEWIGPLTFPQAYAYVCTLLEGFTNLRLTDMDILALSAPQLVVVNEYPVQPYRAQQHAAFDQRGGEPDTVWVQVVVLDATQIRWQQIFSSQESRTSTRTAFPGTWGLL